jgi:hypothetical protein
MVGGWDKKERGEMNVEVVVQGGRTWSRAARLISLGAYMAYQSCLWVSACSDSQTLWRSHATPQTCADPEDKRQSGWIIVCAPSALFRAMQTTNEPAQTVIHRPRTAYRRITHFLGSALVSRTPDDANDCQLPDRYPVTYILPLFVTPVLYFSYCC